jgi:hypothetical protein
VIWYRHWLELRKLILVASIVTLLGAVGYGLAVFSAADYFATTGRFAHGSARFEAIRPMIAGPSLIPWGIHSLFVGFFALFVAGVFVGTGLGSGANSTRSSIQHPSVYFTLSLPVARESLVASRLAAAVAALATVLAVGLVVHCLTLVAIRQPVPLVAMLQTSLLGVVVGLALIAIGVFASLAVAEGLGGLVAFGLTMSLWLTQGGWSWTMGFISAPSVGAFAGVIGGSLLLLTGTLVIVRRKEL